MKPKLLLWLTVAMLALAGCQPYRPCQPQPQRYELHVNDGGYTVIDTATGRVWLITPKLVKQGWIELPPINP